MASINWLTHVQNCWSRDFDYEQYAELARSYKCHVASEHVYKMLCAALHQDMVENIGIQSPTTEERK